MCANHKLHGVEQNQGQIQTKANAQREKKAEKETRKIQVSISWFSSGKVCKHLQCIMALLII